jgi:hypothetical protein
MGKNLYPYFIFFCLLSFFLSLSLSSCFFIPRSNGKNTVSVSGDLSNAVPSAADTPSDSGNTRSISSAISKIGAFPIVAASVSIEKIDNMVIGEVGEDNTFTLELPKQINTAYAIMSLDEGSQGFLSLPASNRETIAAIPAEEGTSDIDMGVVDPLSEDEYQADLLPDQTAAIFDMSLERMYMHARMDDAAKNAMNYYNSFDPETGELFGPDNPLTTTSETGLTHWFFSLDDEEGGYGFYITTTGEIPGRWTIAIDDTERTSLNVNFFDPFIESGDTEVSWSLIVSDIPI